MTSQLTGRDNVGPLPSIRRVACHFRGCDVELEEQRLGLLDQLRYCGHRGYGIYLLRPCSGLCARLAQHSGPGVLGASDDLLDNRSTDANQRRDTDLYGRQYRT